MERREGGRGGFDCSAVSGSGAAALAASRRRGPRASWFFLRSVDAATAWANSHSQRSCSWARSCQARGGERGEVEKMREEPEIGPEVGISRLGEGVESG